VRQEICAEQTGTIKPSSWGASKSVLRGQCLDRRIDDSKRLVSGIAAWERQRNAAAARIKWMFTTAKARTKMGRAYPHTFKES
jgi:hypothetical protein